MPPSLAKKRHGPSTACKRAVSGTISLPSQGFFSPFPHGTGSLSVANEYLALPDGPGRFPQGSSCPAVLRNHWKARSHFHLQGCHLLWPAFPDRSINAFLSLVTSPEPAAPSGTPTPGNVCGPATPRSPCGSHGLGSSDFARHYFRNHGCFLLLRVLRWFTSPGSLRRPIDSAGDSRCSHREGFPIRTSPDHSLLAAPRSFSQLATSFFACLRLGIHTHALSSLTVKSTLNTFSSPRTGSPAPDLQVSFALATQILPSWIAAFKTCVLNARQYSVVKEL